VYHGHVYSYVLRTYVLTYTCTLASELASPKLTECYYTCTLGRYHGTTMVVRVPWCTCTYHWYHGWCTCMVRASYQGTYVHVYVQHYLKNDLKYHGTCTMVASSQKYGRVRTRVRCDITLWPILHYTYHGTCVRTVVTYHYEYVRTDGLHQQAGPPLPGHPTGVPGVPPRRRLSDPGVLQGTVTPRTTCVLGGYTAAS
jgi:hypothetical protein